MAEESKGALKKMGNYERKGVLMSIVDQLRARQDELANVISIEAGKPINDANVEVTRAIESILTQHLCALSPVCLAEQHSRSLLKNRHVATVNSSLSTRQHAMQASR
jgi:acyl-CoA reductase-like NAD-dependent aldehyde dehydrogenase